MEKILANEGLNPIVRNISRFLDPKSLAQCRKVCYSWKNLIDNDKQWWIFQLEHILTKEKIFLINKVKSTKSIKTNFPEWNSFSEEVSKRKKHSNIKRVCQAHVDLF